MAAAPVGSLAPAAGRVKIFGDGKFGSTPGGGADAGKAKVPLARYLSLSLSLSLSRSLALSLSRSVSLSLSLSHYIYRYNMMYMRAAVWGDGRYHFIYVHVMLYCLL